MTVTIPASFDPAARELTVEAARQAGYAALTLLEEPQAALYSWIQGSGGDWRKQVRPGDIILVVDVGGGTTDFSLIAVLEREGTLELHRVAVGDHILLGGDNMDLALAHAVSRKLAAAGHDARCLAAARRSRTVAARRQGDAARRGTRRRSRCGTDRRAQSRQQADRRLDPHRADARRGRRASSWMGFFPQVGCVGAPASAHAQRTARSSGCRTRRMPP